MIEIFGDIINPIEETFIEVRNGLQNWMIEQKCKSLGNNFEEDEEDEDYEEGCFSPDSVVGRAFVHVNAQEKGGRIRCADKPKTITATVGGEKIEVGKKRLKKLYKEMHPGVEKVSEKELAGFLEKICMMERAGENAGEGQD